MMTVVIKSTPSSDDKQYSLNRCLIFVGLVYFAVLATLHQRLQQQDAARKSCFFISHDDPRKSYRQNNNRTKSLTSKRARCDTLSDLANTVLSLPNRYNFHHKETKISDKIYFPRAIKMRTTLKQT